MAKQKYRSMMFWCVIGVLAFLPLSAMAQELEEGELPILLSTGMPAVESLEEILPVGAIAYARANNIQVLLENVDSLLSAFVPEKALPPELQEIFANPQPFLTFFSMQAFGQPVGLSQFSEMFGIAFDRPVSLAMYPMPPEQGFLVSIPMTNATVVTGMVQDALEPEAVEQGTIGDVTYYHVSASNYDLPPDVYIVTSEDTAFFCGSQNVLEMLVQSAEMGTLTSDPVIAKTIDAYSDRDLTITLSPGMFKEQLPMLKDMAAGSINLPFMQARMGLQMIPPAQRLAIDSRLRLELGVDGLEELLNYVEAYASGAYRVLLDELVKHLMNVDGVTLSLNVEQSYQNLAFAFFSQDIQPNSGTQSIPLADVTSALSSLPGDKGVVMAVGKTATKDSAPVRDAVFAAIAEELSARGLSVDGFQALQDFYAAKPHQTPLTSRVDWTVRSMVSIADKLDLSQFDSLNDVFIHLKHQMAGKPFMIPVTLMPASEAGLIEQHYAEKAEKLTLKGQNYVTMHAGLPFGDPIFAISGQFGQEDLGDGLTRLSLDKIYTTRHGLFGFQQHALINRKIMLHQHTDDYELVYASGLDAAEVTSAANAKTVPIPGATVKLFEQAPEGITHLSAVRLLHLLPKALDFLVGFEDLTHREFDAFLAQAQELVETSGAENFENSLLDAKLYPPQLLASLNVDAEGTVYATLPAGLYYPRPKVMPMVQELFAEVNANASEIGGGASFVAVRPGALELSSVHSTEGLALLVKSVVNAFYESYMMSPDGMETLFTTLQHPADFQVPADEAVFVNPFWEAIAENDELPWVAATNRSKRSMTVADMRAMGTAFGSFMVDSNHFPVYPEVTWVWDIEATYEQYTFDDYYMGSTADGWEGPYLYLTDEEGQNYILISYGKDGVPGYTDSEFDEDIIYMNGRFIAPYMLTDYEDMWEELNAALLMAVQAGADEIVEALLNSGADVDAADDAGTTALEFATELELTDIMDILDYWGATPLE